VHIENAVASFFTPASQKAPEKMQWQERGADEDSPRTLLVGRYVPAKDAGADSNKNRRKVAAFDFVSLLSPIFLQYIIILLIFDF
jgi:bifunctional polynucleotide phosphatase/kinase